MKRLAISLGTLISLALCMLPAAPAGAVIAGDLDGSAHPNRRVALLLAALMAASAAAELRPPPNVVLTAAHCTLDSTGECRHVRLLAARDPLSPATHRATSPGPRTRTRSTTASRTAQHAQRDTGVIVLDQPASSKWRGNAPAPPAGRGISWGPNAKGGLKIDAVPARRICIFFQKPASGPKKPEEVSDRTRRKHHDGGHPEPVDGDDQAPGEREELAVRWRNLLPPFGGAMPPERAARRRTRASAEASSARAGDGRLPAPPPRTRARSWQPLRHVCGSDWGAPCRARPAPFSPGRVYAEYAALVAGAFTLVEHGRMLRHSGALGERPGKARVAAGAAPARVKTALGRPAGRAQSAIYGRVT